MAEAKKVGSGKSYGVNLTGEGKTSLRFLALTRKDGSVSAFATHYVRDEKGKVVKSTRGASTTHPSLDAARKWIDKGVEKALAQGWSRKRGGGGRSAADAFTLDTLPKASAK